MNKNTDRIRALNDALRQDLEGGVVVCTSGVSGLDDAMRDAVIEAVRTFSDFTADNDPYREHDFGAFEVAGERFFWKIEYYQKGSDHDAGAEDPSDPTTTDRVMTIMRAEEY